MKMLTSLILFVAIANATAQNKMAPLPLVIIICATNQSAPVTIINISADSWREDYVKQQSVITNLNLTCMSAKSVTSKIEKEIISLIFHDVTSYGHTVVAGKYGEDQRLQTVMAKEWPVILLKTQLVQVNNEIVFDAERFAQKFGTIPENKK